jgi:hypothetical protein
MIGKYHTKMSQKATYLRVFDGDRMLQGDEVTDVMQHQADRITELEARIVQLTRSREQFNREGDKIAELEAESVIPISVNQFEYAFYKVCKGDSFALYGWLGGWKHITRKAEEQG